MKAPAPRWSELRGNSTAPSAKHAPTYPSSGSWHFPGPGSCFFFCSPHLPIAPQCPDIPTSRAEPTPCPEGRRQEVPTPAPHSGSGQPPTDQHWASSLSLQSTQAVPEKLLCCVTGRSLGVSCTLSLYLSIASRWHRTAEEACAHREKRRKAHPGGSFWYDFFCPLASLGLFFDSSGLACLPPGRSGPAVPKTQGEVTDLS